MSENIKLQKQVYNKGDYSKVIDTSFTQLGVKNTQQQIETQPTVNDFLIFTMTYFMISQN